MYASGAEEERSGHRSGPEERRRGRRPGGRVPDVAQNLLGNVQGAKPGRLSMRDADGNIVRLDAAGLKKKEAELSAEIAAKCPVK